MPTPRIRKDNPQAIYFATCTVIGWIDIFTRSPYFDILADSIRYSQKHKGLLLYGYVFMTNHIHLLFSTGDGHRPEDFLRDFKKWTTKEIARELEQDPRHWVRNLLANTSLKKEQNKNQIWQQGNYPETVETDSFFLEKLNYMHMNPVRKGYVVAHKDWKYSSARNWECGDQSVVSVITEGLL